VILVVEHFVFGDQLVATNDEVCFDDEVQVPQQIFSPFRAFDFNRSRGMAELDLHAGMISP
jgi:hypothetical protein